MYFWIGGPHIRLRDRQEFGKRPRAIDPDPARLITEVSPPSQTVSAPPADQVPLPGHDHARVKIVYMASDRFNDADKFVSDRHWCWNRALRPGIPFVDMDVCAANRGTKNSD